MYTQNMSVLEFGVESAGSFKCINNRAIALLDLVTFITCISLNSFVLWAFSKYKSKLINSPGRKFGSLLAMCNLTGLILTYPLMILSNFNCRFYLKHLLISLISNLSSFLKVGPPRMDLHFSSKHFVRLQIVYITSLFLNR